MAMKEIKRPIRFKFNFDKFLSCMGMFAKEAKDVDKLKACKLLYYADKYHLLKYGKPIIGDIYKHYGYGPVPVNSLMIMNEVICEDGVPPNEVTAKGRFKEFIKVKKGFRKHPIFEVEKEPDMDCLSASEQEAIRETIKKYGGFTGGKLIDETHKDASWKKTDMYEEIDYRLFFEDEASAQPAALEYLESIRQDSEFIFGLTLSD